MTTGQKIACRLLTLFLAVVLTLLSVVVLYVVYALLAYERQEDDLSLSVTNGAGVAPAASVGETYKLISYNIGFAAYLPDFGFFMDGGTESCAESEESVKATMASIGDFLKEKNPDFYMIEEVDTDGKRSRHVDEAAILKKALPGYSSVFAQNYDSPFLFYPLTDPIGAAKSGMLTGSKFAVTSSRRRSLPIERGLRKFVDLDRCYSVTRIKTDNGKELILYTLHLSAYTSDGVIATEQLKLLLADMKAEYEAGNYCVAGGDFNKDLLGDKSPFGPFEKEYTWAQPIPDGIFDGTGISLAAPLDTEDPIPSCRNADGPYHEGQYVITVDGFMVSANVTVVGCDVIDTGFAWSDHNPVELNFKLN